MAARRTTPPTAPAPSGRCACSGWVGSSDASPAVAMTTPYRPHHDGEATEPCRSDNLRVALQALVPVNFGATGCAAGRAVAPRSPRCQDGEGLEPSRPSDSHLVVQAPEPVRTAEAGEAGDYALTIGSPGAESCGLHIRTSMTRRARREGRNDRRS
jgi:hypothetical protein